MKTFKQLIKEATNRVILDVSAAQRINTKLRKAGLDGNIRFSTKGSAISNIHKILEVEGLTLDYDAASAVALAKDRGNIAYDIIKNGQTVDNRVLAVTWELLNPHDSDPKRYEFIAYVS